MHNYPLFQEVTADCECCKIPCQMWFTSVSDQVICKGCVGHLGDSPVRCAQRNRQHAGLYRSELLICQEDRQSDLRKHEAEMQRLKDRHAQKVEQLERELAAQRVELGDLRAVIRNGELNPAVEQWFADEEVRDALDKRNRAYRSRDFVFAALWGVARVHRPDEQNDGFCTCGRKESKCQVLQAIEPELRALDDWEDKQIERLRDDLDHGLPWNHPEVLRLGGGHLRHRRLS
ncbi:hypothetical protein ACQI4L_13860 [Mycolicibacterium litorale]|uniref:hypothetical protein n=1 Tax=Mycolicibacterium litorale TaxID=758802 RepID=UPI003CEA42A8